MKKLRKLILSSLTGIIFAAVGTSFAGAEMAEIDVPSDYLVEIGDEIDEALVEDTVDYTSGDYNYTVDDDGTVTITGYSGTETDLTIPSYLGGKKVKAIGRDAFRNCTDLKSVIIPDGVTTIYGTAYSGYGAFKGCTTLISVTIPDSVTFIGANAFQGCTSLKTITIPDGVTSIGVYAFEYCTSLKSLTIPENVTYVGERAFYGCTGITSVSILNGITSIGDSVFSNCTSLKSVTIPDGITSIGESAFSNCTSLKSVTIPDGITSIGESAFSNCTSLTEITIPDSVTSIGERAFYQCTGLKTVTIENGVVSIGKEAFDSCTGLKSITIPDSVTSIGDYAFYGCVSLRTVVIENGVTSMGDGVFSGCTSIKSITIPESAASTGNKAFKGCTSLTNVTILNGITSIGSGAFYGCTSLKSLIIPDSVTSIGSEAFYGCTVLKSVTIPDSVISIGTSAFRDCTSLTNITIPDSVTTIGSYAFSDCDSLTSIIIPDSVTTIGGYAFYGCTSLTSVTIPDSVTSIESDTFKGCTSLTSVTIPDGVTSIGSSAFYGCSSLRSIAIPDSVTSIRYWAFNYCSNLITVIIPDSVTYIDGGYYYETFDGCNKLIIIGETGSYAETYADDEGIPFVDLDYVEVKATATSGAGSVTLSWNAVDNVTGYIVKSADGKTQYTETAITDTTYTVKGLTGGTKYQFKVYACFGDIQVASDTVSGTPTQVGESVKVKATSGNRSIVLTWNAAKNATGYIVKSADGKIQYTEKAITDTTYTVTGLSNGVKYKFRVYACFDDIQVPSSTVSKTPVAKPETVTATAASHQVTLKWNAVPNATSYIVKSADGETQYTKSSIKTTSYTVTGLKNSTQYKFKVYAYSDGKWFASSTISKTPTGKPQNLKAVAGSKKITLSWDKVDGATGYIVKSADGSTQYTKNTIKTNSYTVTGLTGSKQYKFKVYAKVDGKWYVSSTITRTTKK